MSVGIAALCAAITWLLVRPAADPRIERIGSATGDRARRAPRRGAAALAASVAAAAGMVLLVGGAPGLLGAVACIAVLPRALGRLESRADRSRRERLDAQVPLLVDLLAATLASGAPLRASMGAVCEAVGDPTAGALHPVLAAMDLGADPVEAWRAGEVIQAHRPLAEAVIRAAESGAPLSRLLARIGDDLRRERRVTVETAARRAGVRAVAPLAACFLPAFLLTGVVPVVASLAAGLLRSS